MSIPFTQYLRPDGRQVPVSIERPADIEKLAYEFIEKGGRFTAEMLITGQVSFAAEYPVDGESQDIAIEICPNGPEAFDAVDNCVRKAHAYASNLA